MYIPDVWLSKNEKLEYNDFIAYNFTLLFWSWRMLITYRILFLSIKISYLSSMSIVYHNLKIIIYNYFDDYNRWLLSVDNNIISLQKIIIIIII